MNSIAQGHAPVVAGHHHYIGKAAVVERLHRVPSLPAQRIVNADHRRQLPADAQVQMGIGGRNGIKLLPLPCLCMPGCTRVVNWPM